MAKKKAAPLSVGEQLDKELKGQNRTYFAQRVGISRSQLYNLLNDRRKLTFEVAENLGRATDKSAKFWLTLEHEYRMRSKGLL